MFNILYIYIILFLIFYYILFIYIYIHDEGKMFTNNIILYVLYYTVIHLCSYWCFKCVIS